MVKYFQNFSRQKLLVLISLVFLLKLLIVLFFVHHIKLWEDHDIAVNIVNSGEFKYFQNSQWNYNYQFPVYPFIISFLYKVFGIVPKIAVIYNLLIASFSAYYLFYVLLQFIDFFSLPEKIKEQKTTIAFISTVVFMLHPLVSYYAMNNVLPFAQNQFFIILSFYFMFKFINDISIKNAILFSFILGVGFIDRSTLITLTLSFVLLMIVKTDFKKTVKWVSLVAVVSSISVFMWMYRNYKITREIQLTSSMGENMWIGVLPESEGTTYLKNGQTYYAALGEEFKNLGTLSASEQNEFYMNQYWKIVKEEPSRVVKMFFIKLKNFWFFRSDIGIDYSNEIKNLIPLYKFIYLLFLVLAVFASFKIGWKSFYLNSFLIALSLLQSYVYVETRHRIIIEPFLLFLAIVGVFYFIYRREISQSSSLQ